jgi:glucose-6-phosphate 1-dehydrogenase
MKKPEDHILVIFGASGDLTRRKLIPALFSLFQRKLLPKNFAVLGASRTPLSDEDFRKKAGEFLSDGKEIDEFKKLLFYEPVSPTESEDFKKLDSRLESLCKERNIPPNYIFYLSTPPLVYETISRNLEKQGMERSENHFRRLVVEKPFGTNLESARSLNKSLLVSFAENQIYRIDHYLGKESVQNLLVTRFANGIFEPLWNRNFIERIEVTSAEEIGVEGRSGYYEQAGALRDMLQNHLLQLVGFVAMEPPVVIEADAIRNEIVKVFQSIRPITGEEVAKSVVRGQYVASVIQGEHVRGYREEPGVRPDSRTETFAAMRFFIDNWRWAGIPFYIRTGKKLPARITEIVIHFKQVPHHLFNHSGISGSENNRLIIRIQPNEGILLQFKMKTPGAGFHAQTVDMDFLYTDLANVHLPSAYERLLLDCMLGDATLYSRRDAVEEAWKFVQPIMDAWENDPRIPVYGYPAGTWGPESAQRLIQKGQWHYPCKSLTDDEKCYEL